MSEELLNNGKNIVQRNEKGQLLPGSVLNPDGKPVGTKHLSTQLKEMLFEVAEGSEHTHGTLINKRVLKKAIMDGDMRAIELVYERIEGGVPQENKNLNVNVNLGSGLDNKEFDKLMESYANRRIQKVSSKESIQ